MKRTNILAILLLILFAQNYKSQIRVKDAEEKIYFEPLKPIIKNWLRGKKIKSEFQGTPENRLQSYLIDVNGDGKKELAIRNLCAPVGNCQFWIFKNSGRNYNIILKSLPGAVQTFKLKSTKTNGYFDLETRDHGDSWSGKIEVYKFDGRNYVVSECSTYSYSYFKDGKIFQLNKPKIIPVKCAN